MRDTNPQTLRQELQRRRAVILETARRADAELDSLRSAERDPEFEEGAQTAHEALTFSRLEEAQRSEIRQIDAAIARIDAGKYGTCRDCGQVIDPRRLAALPFALLCTGCAAQRERTPGAPVEEPPKT